MRRVVRGKADGDGGALVTHGDLLAAAEHAGADLDCLAFLAEADGAFELLDRALARAEQAAGWLAPRRREATLPEPEAEELAADALPATEPDAAPEPPASPPAAP